MNNGKLFNSITGKIARAIQIQLQHKPVEDRFWNKVIITSPDECWEWIGTKCKNYGHFRFSKGRTIGAHRAAWILTNGEIKKGIEVCHKCDNPSCVNPSHLFLGTHRENMSDCAKKGRIVVSEKSKETLREHARSSYGSNNKISKLNNEIISKAIKEHADGMSYRDLGRKYNVTCAAIHRAVTGRTWKRSMDEYKHNHIQ